MDIRMVKLDNGKYRVYIENKPVLDLASKTEAEKLVEFLKRAQEPEIPKR